MRFVCLGLAFFVGVLSCSTKKVSGDTESIARGESIYKKYCVACHMADGGGAPPMNPPLHGTSFVMGDSRVLIAVLLKGMSQQEVDGENYHNVMPPMDYLTDEQIADVLTYVRNSFGNQSEPVKPEEVKVLRN